MTAAPEIMSAAALATGKREYRMIVALGAPASGKTSWARGQVKKALAAGRPVRVVSPTLTPWPVPHEWPGKRPVPALHDPKVKVPAIDAWLQARQIDSRGALLVFDDADAFLDSSTSWIWRDFLATFRHWGVDVIFIARRPQRLPREVDDNASHLVIFRVRGPQTMERIRLMVPDAAICDGIPTEPHHFLLVDQDTGDHWEGKTIRD